jgi:deoxyhypusine synthase
VSISISDFIDRHFRHFNAAALRDAADAYRRHVDGGGVMLITLAGAMSTAELGISLAEMIRKGQIHAICTTGGFPTTATSRRQTNRRCSTRI